MAGPDLSIVTSVVDFGTATTAVISVGAVLIVVYIARKAAEILKSMIKGGGGLDFNPDDWIEDHEYQRIRREQARIDIRSRMGGHF